MRNKVHLCWNSQSSTEQSEFGEELHEDQGGTLQLQGIVPLL